MVGQRDGSSGLVLGLTMAETAILIIFVLLLTLTALLGRESAERRKAEHELERVKEIEAALKNEGKTAEDVVAWIRELREVQRDAADWRLLVANIENAGLLPDPTPEAIVSVVAAAGEWEWLEQLFKEVGLESPAEDGRDLVELAVAAHEAGITHDEIAAVREGGGRGTDHPSCWYDDDGSVAYLFDVALRDDGFVMQPTSAVSRHEDPRRTLPLSRIRTGELLTGQQFLEQTRPVYDWSVGQERECRFFVRAFDQTSADEKELYKNRMRTLESRFYKYESPSGVPRSLATEPRQP